MGKIISATNTVSLSDPRFRFSDARLAELERNLPSNSALTASEIALYTEISFASMAKVDRVPDHVSVNDMEFVALNPPTPETALVIDVADNSYMCAKELVTPYLLRHYHGDIYAYLKSDFSGGSNVPPGTIDVKQYNPHFKTPNDNWDPNWTYVMIWNANITDRVTLTHEEGYIYMIPAKLERFELRYGDVCMFVDPVIFDHPANRAMAEVLTAARDRGDECRHEYVAPSGFESDLDDLAALMLKPQETVHIAHPKEGVGVAHAWVQHPLHRETYQAVIGEISNTPMQILPVGIESIVRERGLDKGPWKSSNDACDVFHQAVMSEAIRSTLNRNAYLVGRYTG